MLKLISNPAIKKHKLAYGLQRYLCAACSFQIPR